MKKADDPEKEIVGCLLSIPDAKFRASCGGCFSFRFLFCRVDL